MKVYVDENDYVITYCAMTGRESLETSKSPIIVESLADYTKQVRKEVLNKVYEVLEQAVPHDLCWSWTVIKKELDQIQGEIK